MRIVDLERRLGPALTLLALSGLGGLAALAACDPLDELRPGTPVASSVDAEPRWTVDINRFRGSLLVAYSPRCFEVQLGQTVEFRNFLPRFATNVTSVAGPAPLYSPNLVWPYNYVSADDPDNPACEEVVDDVCTAGPEFSYWRHTFDVAGVYDWLDTNQGLPGRKVIDPYYGTETFIGVDPNSPRGTICVPAEDGSGCGGVCCVDDDDCGGDTRCIRSALHAIGRCLTPTD